MHRLGAVCVGAFLLAQTGLLNGRRATAHWKFGRELATRYPGVRVEHDPLWVKDGGIYTSAGLSAGIDLALAWVEKDCGAGMGTRGARELVLFFATAGWTATRERFALCAFTRLVGIIPSRYRGFAEDWTCD